MSDDKEQPMVKVIFADDHAVVRRGLLAFFETADRIEVIGLASTGAEAVTLAEKHHPQVVLLDLLMPDQPAVMTIEMIKSVSPQSQVVVLTSHEGDEYIPEVLKAGALSYVLKNINPDELIGAVRKAARGESVLNARLAQAFLDKIQDDASDQTNSLTGREDEVLILIAKGLTNGEIADKLCISETTVKSHVSSILSKLYLSDRTKLAVYAWENGLMNKWR